MSLFSGSRAIKTENAYYDVLAQHEGDYKKYSQEWSQKDHCFRDLKEDYNQQISTINARRSELYNENKSLYTFLQRYGDLLSHAPEVFEYSLESGLREEFPSKLEAIVKARMKTAYRLGEKGHISRSKAKHNKAALEAYETRRNRWNNESTKNLCDCDLAIQKVQDGLQVGRLYLDTISVIKNTIDEKITPQMNLVHAFFFADAIAKQIESTGTVCSPITPKPAGAYLNTPYQCHIQFIKNALTFYDLCYQFFTTTTLTNLLKKEDLSEEDMARFKESIENFKRDAEAFNKSTGGAD